MDSVELTKDSYGFPFLFQTIENKVLELMREVSSDQNPQEDDLEDSSDVSGYHSDSDSAVMMSGNSPFVSKSARYNFLSRSGNTYNFHFSVFLFF